MKLLPATLIMILTTTPVLASPACDKAEDQTSLNECAAQDFLAADAALNHTYKQIKLRLTGDQGTTDLLTQAQREWIRFRDAECAFSASATAGGSIAPMIIASCKAQLTVERNKQLLHYLACEEGDVSCPVPPAD